MVGICFFSPFSYTDTERMALAEREGVFGRFGDMERDRINKISNPSGKALSLGGIIALGRAVDALGAVGADMRILRDALGKPHFACGAPCFSISHADRLSVAAISQSGEIGIDIERIDRDRDIGRIARKFFSEAEQKELAEAEDRVREFYRIWTAKESMMKQGGEGMISVMRSDSALAEASGERSFARYAISFEGEEYILTICTVGEEKIELIECDGISILRR